jgi:hypothetical protein
MMGRVRVACWALVLISLAVNALFWLRHRRAVGSPSPDYHTPAARAPAVTANQPALAPAPGPARAPAATGDLASCRVRLAAVEATAATRSAELREALPPNVLFRLGSPNAAAAASFGPLVERALARADGGSADSRRLECRDEVCKLAIVTPSDSDPNVWSMALQRPDAELREQIVGMSFHVGNPTQDPLTREGLVEHSVYFRLRQPAAGPDSGTR